MAGVTSVSGAAAGVVSAIETAAARTGVGFEYLLKAAERESAFNPNAEAKTSSAAGLFQFIEQTWLDTVKRFGPAHGLGEAAAQIERAASGRYAIADPVARQQILDMRFDPDKASLMAGEMTREAKLRLEEELGRPVDEGDLYAAHFLGVNGARKMIEAADQTPNTSAAELFPAAAKANKRIFYDNGRPRSAEEVLALLKAPHQDGAAPRPAPAETPSNSEAGAAGRPIHHSPRPWASPIVLTPTVMAALQALDKSWIELSSDKDDA
ncbi:MAG: transglycosylase SLT domain-containing protein [Pseudomonadota bacterium]